MERLTANQIKDKANQIALKVNNGNGGTVEIVGKWIWISFNAKPDKELREYLKSERFFWNPKRSVWQCNCGYFSRHSERATPEIKAYYGTEPIEEVLQ